MKGIIRGSFIETTEKPQGLKVTRTEGIAYRMGHLDDDRPQVAQPMCGNGYGGYMPAVLAEAGR